jgi:hypothetical protein
MTCPVTRLIRQLKRQLFPKPWTVASDARLDTGDDEGYG